MATPTPELPRLTRKQELAIAAILAGASDGEAAKAARVTRETVNRWRHADPQFAAELNRRRAERWSGPPRRGTSTLRRSGASRRAPRTLRSRCSSASRVRSGCVSTNSSPRETSRPNPGRRRPRANPSWVGIPP